MDEWGGSGSTPYTSYSTSAGSASTRFTRRTTSASVVSDMGSSSAYSSHGRRSPWAHVPPLEVSESSLLEDVHEGSLRNAYGDVVYGDDQRVARETCVGTRETSHISSAASPSTPHEICSLRNAYGDVHVRSDARDAYGDVHVRSDAREMSIGDRSSHKGDDIIDSSQPIDFS